MGATGQSRVLQIHPTRQCNLRCLHCYSTSSPRARGMLDLGLLCDAVSDAAREGYNLVSLSGGEPLLYKPLRELLQHARSCGMNTTVTTNGMLLTPRNIERIRDVVDVLAISLDGVPASHNRMRGSSLAFESMRSHLADVRAAGINFGFIFTLTQHNLDELDWVSEFALTEGASLLQIHPLEAVGNAQQNLPGKTPDAKESAYAWLLGRQTENGASGKMRVQVDLAYSDMIKQHPERVFADTTLDTHGEMFSDLLSPLVIEADGQVTPIQYGFAPHWRLGNLSEARLSELMPRWRDEHLDNFRALCRSVYDEICKAPKPYFLNWYDMLGHRAELASSRALLAA